MAPARIATRLTCFALISAIESDLRDSIRLAITRATGNIFPEDVKARARKRWDDDRADNDLPMNSDEELLDYIEFADIGKIIHGIADEWGVIDKTQTAKLAERLISLAPLRNRVCHSRPLEPDDFAVLYDAARDFLRQYAPVGWASLQTTTQKLDKDPSFVLHLTIPSFWMADQVQIPNNLPLPEFDDTGFWGRISDRREVRRLLDSPHPVISIVGEGRSWKNCARPPLSVRSFGTGREDQI